MICSTSRPYAGLHHDANGVQDMLISTAPEFSIAQSDGMLIFHGIAVIQRDLADVETQRQRTKVCYTIQNYEQEPSGY